MKKCICFLGAILITIGVVISSGVLSMPAMAADPPEKYACPADSRPSEAMNNRTFLMFRPWYHGLCFDSKDNPVPPDDDSEEGEEFTKFVWVIIMNIAYDLFAAVGVIATGYVIYGGYAFLTSGGDSGKAAKAKKALIGAVVGILVSLSATMIVDTITGAIGTTREGTPENVLNGVLGIVFSVAGAIAAGFVVYGGISYITSSGDPGKANRAKTILTYAIIGLLIVLMAYGIVNLVVGATAS